MKPLEIVLLFSQLVFAQSDVDVMKASSNYSTSTIHMWREDVEKGIPQAQYNLGLFTGKSFLKFIL
jgi:hypothetical protein